MKTNTNLKIFVVDDDPISLAVYQQHLRNLGYSNVSAFEEGISCMINLSEQPDIIFLNHQMDFFSGVEALKKIKRFNPDVYVVFISEQEDIQSAINLINHSAFDCIVKGNNDTNRIDEILKRVHEERRFSSINNKNLFYQNSIFI